LEIGGRPPLIQLPAPIARAEPGEHSAGDCRVIAGASPQVRGFTFGILSCAVGGVRHIRTWRHGAAHYILFPRDALLLRPTAKPGSTRSGVMHRPRAISKRVRVTRLVQPPPDKVAPLRNHPVFHEFQPAGIEHLGAYMTRRKVAQGATIFAKGDPGATLMAVLSGSVRICVSAGDGHEAVFNIIKPGQVFGEVALLDGRARTADAVAITDCELMV